MSYYLDLQCKKSKESLRVINQNILGTNLEDADFNKNLEELGYDSLSFIELILAIEEKFLVKVPDDFLVFSKIKTLKDLEVFLEKII